MMTQQQFDACQRDFREFLRLVWRLQGLPSPSRVQLNMAYWFQHGPNRRQCLAARGFAKSYIAMAWVLWNLWLDPDKEIMIISKTEEMAKQFSRLARAWLDMLAAVHPSFTAMVPGTDDLDQVKSWNIGNRTKASANPSIRAASITGQITGARAHIIIPDDVETWDNSKTFEQRENLVAKLSECEAIIHPGGVIHYNGTFQSCESTYIRLDEMGYTIRMWPAEYPSGPVMEGKDWLAPMLQQDLDNGVNRPGDATFPGRYDAQELEKRRSAMGEAKYRLHFLLDPSLSDEDRYPLRLRDIIVYSPDKTAPANLVWSNQPKHKRMDLPVMKHGKDCFYSPGEVDERPLEFQLTTLTVDPSGRGKDETAWNVTKYCNGFMYVVESDGNNLGFEDTTLRAIAESCYRHRCQRVVTEANYGDGMFTRLLTSAIREYYAEMNKGRKEPQAPPRMEEVKVRGRKEQRICDTLEPLLNQHRVVFSDAVARDDTLAYQLSYMTRDIKALLNDDRIDCLALAAAQFIQMMDRDRSREIERLDEEEAWRQVSRFDIANGLVQIESPPVDSRFKSRAGSVLNRFRV